MNEHVGYTSSIVFSENGYLLASGDSGGRLRLWDLRKLKATKSFDCIRDSFSSVYRVTVA